MRRGEELLFVKCGTVSGICFGGLRSGMMFFLSCWNNLLFGENPNFRTSGWNFLIGPLSLCIHFVQETEQENRGEKIGGRLSIYIIHLPVYSLFYIVESVRNERQWYIPPKKRYCYVHMNNYYVIDTDIHYIHVIYIRYDT